MVVSYCTPNPKFRKRVTQPCVKSLMPKAAKPCDPALKISTSMSVNRLLNKDESSDEFDDMMTLSDASSLSSLDSPTPSPTFRVIQTYPPDNNSWSNEGPLLPPIQQAPPSHEYTLPSIQKPSAHVAQDIIDTISATILLQRLSQDDGARPFRPFESSVIPSKVIVGHQEFTICWD
ncbi:uncharacterized protein B0P05DRAFT_521362 [Gilbertella persicaria]|uniref:uncharacterized protein n=1 Tax=Gilbertella persicaria TaxID=101096 RepID=UPI00221E4287|nr:uncharacterized protein B0P05DRAFT_521362 [Gilbertella persicaria]KAI8098319.1 hypothetical protein B0P05DRAFT_521362 [Gilbertella persicaria]